MNKPKFFADSTDFRDWLMAHAAVELELLVGFYKVSSNRASMTWSESVDEALCYGWIDGVRKRIDDEAYSIRFTPRKPTSVWSAVNMTKFEQLQAQGRMTPAGEQAFAHRKADKSVVYGYEQKRMAELTPGEMRIFKRNKAAWTFFENTPPSYRKKMLHWVTTAKKAATRDSRFTQLVDASGSGKRLQ